MKRFVLLLTLASALAACTGGMQSANLDPQCPSDPNQQMSHDQWKACYGYQDHDASGPGK